jgi:hypothetical protein
LIRQSTSSNPGFVTPATRMRNSFTAGSALDQTVQNMIHYMTIPTKPLLAVPYDTLCRI